MGAGSGLAQQDPPTVFNGGIADLIEDRLLSFKSAAIVKIIGE